MNLRLKRKGLCIGMALLLSMALPAAALELFEDIQPDTLVLYPNIQYQESPLMYSQARYVAETSVLCLSIQNQTVASAGANVEDFTVRVTDITVDLPEGVALRGLEGEEPIQRFHIDTPYEIPPQHRMAITFDIALTTSLPLLALPLSVRIAGEGFAPMELLITLPVENLDQVYQADGERALMLGTPLSRLAVEVERLGLRVSAQNIFMPGTFRFLFSPAAGEEAVSRALGVWMALSCLSEEPFPDGGHLALSVTGAEGEAPLTLVFLCRQLGQAGDRNYFFGWYAENTPPHAQPVQLGSISQRLLAVYMRSVETHWQANGEAILQSLGVDLPAGEPLRGDGLLSLANGLLDLLLLDTGVSMRTLSLGDMEIPLP